MPDLDRPAPARPASHAAAALSRILADTLPLDATPCYRRIVRARFDGEARIFATLELFDGGIGKIEAWCWRPGGWAYRWTRLDGGDLAWEDGRWLRINRESLSATTH